MSDIALDCAIVEVTGPRQSLFQVASPARIIQTSTPAIAVDITSVPRPIFGVQAPYDGPRLLVPIIGPPGPSGADGGEPELLDMNTIPVDPPNTYLRFARDGDGDVQAIYLGTVN